MNIQQERFLDTRGFRIAVLAWWRWLCWLLPALLVRHRSAGGYVGVGGALATRIEPDGRPANTSSDYVGRLINASEAAKAASLAALAKSRSDFYAELNASGASREDSVGRLISPSAAARLTALAALAKSRADFHAEFERVLRRRPGQIRCRLRSQFVDRYDRMNSSAAASGGASLAELAGVWAPFYAGLDKAMKDAGARP